MATDSIKITSPVEVQNDAKARVAYDLMDLISRREEISDADKKSRDYWLTLYVQCLRASNGDALKYVLERK